MSDALSIDSAAEEYPKRIALVAGGERLTYAELASRASDVVLAAPNVHRASATLETALVLYASLQRKLCVILASRTSTDTELANIRVRINTPETPRASLVLFTSGSSGASKGVLLGREALRASAEAAGKVLGWAEGDRWLCCLPLSHIGGISVLTRALFARKTMILCESFEACNIANDIVRHRATHISLVPTMLWRLLEYEFRPPTHLRVTLIGGAALDERLAARARDAGYLLRPSYGMTETSSMIVCDGHPLPGVQLHVDDDQALRVRAPMLMSGYLPTDGMKRQICDGWFHTSDKATQSNGTLQILGRVDTTIISGGENIDLTEIEAALNAHPRVHASLAVGVPDPEWGQKLVALVVSDGDPSNIQVETLIGHKHPKNLLHVDELPLLENGKLDRRQALQLAMTLKRVT